MTATEIRTALLGRPRDVLMLTLMGEAAGESEVGQVAVACCIRNRAQHPRWWGTDIASVCLKKWQFSCWWETATPNSQRLFALANTLLASAAPLDSDLCRRLYGIADAVISGEQGDITHGADHYVTHRLLAVAPPAWSLGKHPCAHIGGHAFFRLELKETA